MATLSPRRICKRARALAMALAVGATVCACAGLSAGSAVAVTPSPPPGAPAMESAPSSLVGLDPELPPGVISASAAPGSHWTPEKAAYGSASTNDIAVAGAGGTTIRVNEIYPTTASGQPATGPFPVLLTMTPYGKGQGGSSTPGSASSPTSGAATGGADNYLVQRGYIEVVEDVRGTGDSNGSWGLFDPIQQRDAIKVLKWAAHLPHANGKVGTYGPSYLGIDQLLLAGAVGRHSPLKAIFPMVPANDIYRDTSFMGGLLDFEFSETYLGLTGTLNTATPLSDATSDPTLLSDLAGVEADHVNGLASYHAATTANILSGGDEAYDGAYWQARNPQNVLARVAANHIPAYMVGGEFDIFQNGEPVNYAELQNAWAHRSATAPMISGQPTTGRYQLIVGPWEHLNGSSVDVDPLELEWFDTWLKGEKTGMARTRTPLHYYDLGSGAFDEASAYPFKGATPSRLYFGAGGTLTSAAPSGSASGTPSSPIPGLPLPVPPTPLPTAPAATGDTIVWSPSGVPCGRPIDQWSMGGLSVPAGSAGFLAPCATDDRLAQVGPWATSYTSAPLDHAETLAGPVTATVYASATTSQTELVAELEEVTPGRHVVPAHGGRAAGLAARGEREPVLDRRRHDRAALSPVHPGVVQARGPRRDDPVPDPDLPDAGHDLLGRPAAAQPLHRRHPAPHPPAPAALQPRRRRLHHRPLGGGSVVAHVRDARLASSSALALPIDSVVRTFPT
jgi:uncharacterized protein